MPLLVQSKEQFACTDNWNWMLFFYWAFYWKWTIV